MKRWIVTLSMVEVINPDTAFYVFFEIEFMKSWQFEVITNEKGRVK